MDTGKLCEDACFGLRDQPGQSGVRVGIAPNAINYKSDLNAQC